MKTNWKIGFLIVLLSSIHSNTFAGSFVYKTAEINWDLVQGEGISEIEAEKDARSAIPYLNENEKYIDSLDPYWEAISLQDRRDRSPNSPTVECTYSSPKAIDFGEDGKHICIPEFPNNRYRITIPLVKINN